MRTCRSRAEWIRRAAARGGWSRPPERLKRRQVCRFRVRGAVRAGEAKQRWRQAATTTVRVSRLDETERRGAGVRIPKVGDVGQDVAHAAGRYAEPPEQFGKIQVSGRARQQPATATHVVRAVKREVGICA